ncbi:low molecular weight phosphotyrosine protein phosphatase [Sagittula sp. NFXS13]|uniref:low molecular weight protein-tyrosine-phosphatase n=1 Tax=Sagittula sp. NFXS13 TaxID=2819095 RepID=UPI0032DFBC89
MTQRILFVCLGNICRSPSAEGVVKRKAALRDVNLDCDSAGTGAYHVGEPPYGAMQRAAISRGYDLSDLRARQVTRPDFAAFDLLVAMDADNLAHLERMRPQGGAEVVLFTDYAPDCGTNTVPDPYYTRDFDGTLDLIERCAEGLLDALAAAPR